MPWDVVRDTNACPVTKPWAVKKSDTHKVVACHATRDKAIAQQKALYVALRKEGKLSEYFLAPVEHLFAESPPTLAEGDNVRWVQAFPYDSWDHPIYGTTTVTPDIGQQYVRNFKENVRGQDLPIGYNHGQDLAKGEKAAGWIRDMEARDNGVFFKVEFTPAAIEELRNGEWKYFSSESFDEWEHPHTKEKYQYVVAGGALTNKPWVKGMLPINFSEVLTGDELKEAQKETREWSEAYIDSLPDSSFMYIESGGSKDSDGRTTPRSLRYLPVRDDSGKIDEAHVLSAVERIPQMVGLSEDIKDRLQGRAKTLLSAMKKMSEAPEEVLGWINDGESVTLDPEAESKEWEHSEPGTGNPPQPRTEGDGSDEPDRTGGWRRPTPPIVKEQEGSAGDTAVTESRTLLELKEALKRAKALEDPDDETQLIIVEAETLLKKDVSEVAYSEIRSMCRKFGELRAPAKRPRGGKAIMGELTEKDLRELMRITEVEDEEDIVDQIKRKFGELDELQKTQNAADQEKIFAEKYPQYWEEHRKLMERDRKNAAHNFSESVSHIHKSEGYGLKKTGQGLSTLAKTKIEDTHRKFAEGTATVEDFEECVKTITQGGIVMFGEIGTNQDGEDPLPTIETDSAAGIAGNRKLFADVLSKIQKDNPNMTFEQALTEAGKKHPDLAEAYKIALPA